MFDFSIVKPPSRVIYRANCWDCNGFYIGKTKRRLHDRKTEHFKALAKNGNTSAIADHVKATGHNIKWDHFDILAKGKTDYHCKNNSFVFVLIRPPSPALKQHFFRILSMQTRLVSLN